MKITPYNEIRDKLCTLTIINCEHKNLFWRLVGHTAGIYVCQETGQVMCFESTTRDGGTGGVKLTPFGLWLYNYPGRVYVRIPKFKVNKQTCNAGVFIAGLLGTSYPDITTWSGRMKLALSSLDLNIFGKDIFTYKGKDRGVFCTHLIALWYQYMGYMDLTIPAYEFEPDDTRKGGKAEKRLIDCTWSDEIRIK